MRGKEVQQQNSKITASLVFPAVPQPAQPDVQHANLDHANLDPSSLREKNPNEEIGEARNAQQPSDDSGASIAQEGDHQRSIVVKYGDTMEKLALRHLGSRYALNELIDNNPQITDINRIYPGQRVYLSRSEPNEAGESPASETGSQPPPSLAGNTSHIDDSKMSSSARAGKN